MQQLQTDSWILESLLDAMIVVVLVVNIVGYSAITITPPLSDAPADLSGRMVRWLTLTVVARTQTGSSVDPRRATQPRRYVTALQNLGVGTLLRRRGVPVEC